MISYLKKELDFKLSQGFKLSDLKELFVRKTLLKILIENNMMRSHKFCHHVPEVRDYFVLHALKHSFASALALSTDLGGPAATTIRDRCSPKVKMLPYLEEENLSQHCVVFKDFLERAYINNPNSPYKQVSEIPI